MHGRNQVHEGKKGPGGNQGQGENQGHGVSARREPGYAAGAGRKELTVGWTI